MLRVTAVQEGIRRQFQLLITEGAKATSIHTPLVKIEFGRKSIQASAPCKNSNFWGNYRRHIFLHKLESGVLEEHSPSMFVVTMFAAM